MTCTHTVWRRSTRRFFFGGVPEVPVVPEVLVLDDDVDVVPGVLVLPIVAPGVSAVRSALAMRFKWTKSTFPPVSMSRKTRMIGPRNTGECTTALANASHAWPAQWRRKVCKALRHCLAIRPLCTQDLRHERHLHRE